MIDTCSRSSYNVKHTAILDRERVGTLMEGRSHLLIGLTAGIVLDNFVHLSGDPLTMAKAVPLALLVNKAVYYIAVGIGALLPDIDNARSTMGHKFGIISKTIQKVA